MENQTRMGAFTSRALNISACVYFTYLVVNFVVILGCQFLEIGMLIDPVCRTTGFAADLTENIPVINHAVSFLLETNQTERAEVVSRFYSFSWITSLFAFFLFCIVFSGLLIFLTPDKRREIGILYFATINTQNRKTENLDRITRFMARRWPWVILLLLSFSFYMAFFGDYDFDSYSILDNRVYERDVDLFRVPLFLFFAWLLLSILMIVFTLRCFVREAGLRLDEPGSRSPSQDSQIDDDSMTPQSRADERPRDGPWWPD